MLTSAGPAEVQADQRELVTYLLRFFVPQILLYAAGTIATAVLYACAGSPVTAAAPIGNTVVMVACLAIFRAVAGPDPGLVLSTGGAAARGGRHRWGDRLRGHPRGRGRAGGFRLRPRRPAAATRGGRGAAPLGLGRRAAHRRRAAARDGHRGRRRRRGRRGRLPGGLGDLPGALRGAGPAHPHGDPPPSSWSRPASTGGRGSLPRCGGRSSAWRSSWCPRLGRDGGAGRPGHAARVVRRGLGRGQRGPGRGGGRPGARPAAYSAFLLLARGCYALGDSRTPGSCRWPAPSSGSAVMVSARSRSTARPASSSSASATRWRTPVGAVVLGPSAWRRTGGSLCRPPSGGSWPSRPSSGWGCGGRPTSLVDDRSGRLADLAVVAGLGLVGPG